MQPTSDPKDHRLCDRVRHQQNTRTSISLPSYPHNVTITLDLKTQESILKHSISSNTQNDHFYHVGFNQFPCPSLLLSAFNFISLAIPQFFPPLSPCWRQQLIFEWVYDRGIFVAKCTFLQMCSNFFMTNDGRGGGVLSVSAFTTCMVSFYGIPSASYDFCLLVLFINNFQNKSEYG